MDAIAQLRAVFARWYLALLWLNVVISVAAGIFANGSVQWLALIAAVAIAAVPTVAFFVDATSTASRLSSAAAQAGMVALIVANAAGTQMQIDVHMYFFAILAISAGWVDWRAIIAFALVTALHHLILNFTIPLAVFPDGANFARVALHAVIVVLEVAALVLIVHQVNTAQARSNEALDATEAARQQANQLADAQRDVASLSEGQRKSLQGNVATFQNEIGQLLGDVRNHAATLNGLANDLSGMAQQTSERATEAARMSESASNNVQSVAAATDQLTNATAEIDGGISRTRHVMEAAQSTVAETTANVAQLSLEAEKINEVVNIIQDIANQTNLLALNATIEAARAGEMGRGFAVVASEVKSLAGQTSRATEDISNRISGITSSTALAVKSIDAIRNTIEEVSRLTLDLANSMGQQRAATSEISRNVQEAAEATQSVARVVSDANVSTRKTAENTEHLRATSNDVSSATTRLEGRVSDFLRRVAGA